MRSTRYRSCYPDLLSLIQDGIKTYPFVISLKHKPDYISPAYQWCEKEFGKDAVRKIEMLGWAIMTEADWACINYDFGFDNLRQATEFKLQWS